MAIWGKDFIETYKKRFKQQSIDNEHLADATMLCMIGQANRNAVASFDDLTVSIDGRIHPMVIQTSGTGKGEAFAFMERVCDIGDIAFVDEQYTTSAGLVGTIREGGKVKGSFWDPGKGTGILGWEEANMLFKATQDESGRDMLEQINKAVNPSGDVRRKLANGSIEYKTKKSIFCTTYPPEPENIDVVNMIKSGFISRFMLFYEHKSIDEIDDIVKNIMSSLSVKPKNKKISEDGENIPLPMKNEYKNDMEEIADTLNMIEERLGNKGKPMKVGDGTYKSSKVNIQYYRVTEEAGKKLSDTSQLRDIMAEFNTSTEQVAGKAFARWSLMLWKVSSAMAAIDNMNPRIVGGHVDEAKRICFNSWKSSMEFIEEYKDTFKSRVNRLLEERIIKMCHANDSKITVSEIARDTGASRDMIQSAIDDLETRKLIRVVGGTSMNMTAGSEIEWLGYDYVEEEMEEKHGEITNDQPLL